MNGFALGMAVLGLLALLVARPVQAYPVLQLDIVGGAYDQGTETIVASDNVFTVFALGKKSKINTSDDHFLSVAVIDANGNGVAENSSFSAGSFVMNGQTYQVNHGSPDIEYGTPPSEATADPLLGSHGIFDTYYFETGFFFDGDDTTTAYNSEDDPGAVLFDENGDDLYYVAYQFDVSGLTGGFRLHVDLYDDKWKSGDTTVGRFAPFSHDAESGIHIEPNEDVPEPGTLAIFATGVFTAGWMRRRRLKKDQIANAA